MAQWGTRRRVMFIGQHGENKPQLSISISDDEDSKDEEQSIVNEFLAIPEFKKRKHQSCRRLQEVKAKQRQRSSSSKRKQTKLESKIERWSADRYKLAEQSMLEVMKAEGATFASPIARPVLRTAARKCIGDTGLLDHLLKHIDGKVAPGGVERFRRWFNANGIMEYWLENADLVNIRQEAGVQDPYWIPHSRSISASLLTEDSLSAEDSLRLLKAEMAIIKRDMQESVSKNLEEDQGNTEVVHKEVVKWQTRTERRMDEIANCLKGMQGMLSGELETWKAKVEQQLVEITNTLSSMQAVKQSKTSGPPASSERWEDWLESTNLDNIQGDELATWFDSNNVLNAEHDVAVQDLYLTTPPTSPLQLNCGDNLIQDPIKSREQERLKETFKIKRDTLEPVSKKQEDDERNVAPDSSATANSKSELDTSIHTFQEIFRELFNWKAKTEQQLTEISNTLHGNKQALQLKD